MNVVSSETLSSIVLSQTKGSGASPQTGSVNTESSLRPSVSMYLGSQNSDLNSLLVLTDAAGESTNAIGFAQLQESAFRDLTTKINQYTELAQRLQLEPENEELQAATEQAKDQLSKFIGRNLVAEPVVRLVDATTSDLAEGLDSPPPVLSAIEFPIPSPTNGGTAAMVAIVDVDMEDVIFGYHSANSCPLCQANATAPDTEDYPAKGPSTTTGNVTGATGVSSTGLNYIDSLNSGIRWAISPNETLTYSMYDSDVGLSYPGWIPYELGDQEANMRIAFETWDRYLPFTLEEVEESGTTVGELRAMYNDITAANAAAGSAAQGAYPEFDARAGDSYYHLNYTNGVANANQGTLASNLDFSVGTYGFLTAIHEIGHNLGLKHPFGSGTVLPTEQEDIRYSVMAYSSIDDRKVTFTPTGGGGYSYGFSNLVPITPMVFDIAAVERWYGTVTDTNSGDTTYRITDPDAIQAIVDSSGIDTLDLSGMEQRSIVDLTPGAYSSLGYWSMDDQITYYASLVGESEAEVRSIFETYDTISTSGNISDGVTRNGGVYERQNNLGIAYSAIIENVIGSSGNDEITGNAADNEITGGGGDDTIDGGDGVDTAIFSGRMSQYTITDNNDGSFTVADTVAGRDGTDTLTNIEFFRFTDKTYTASGSNAGAALNNPGRVEILTKGSTKEGSGGSYLAAAIRANPILRGLASPHGFAGINQLLELQAASAGAPLLAASRSTTSIANQFNNAQNQMQQNIIANLRPSSGLDSNSAQTIIQRISNSPNLMANAYTPIQADVANRWLRA